MHSSVSALEKGQKTALPIGGHYPDTVMQCWKWLPGTYLLLMPDARGSCCLDNKAGVWQVTGSLPVGWQENGGTCLMDQVLPLMGKAVDFLMKQSVAVHLLWFSAKTMPKYLVRPFMLSGSCCTQRHLLTGKTACGIRKRISFGTSRAPNHSALDLSTVRKSIMRVSGFDCLSI